MDFQAAFQTLGTLVDCSVNFQYNEKKRIDFQSLAYKYKQAINSFVSESNYAQQDIEEFERYEKTFDHGFRLYRPWIS